MLLLPDLIEEKIKWYYWEKMKAKGFATLHVVELGDNDPTIEVLEELYPGISQTLKKGDIIEDHDDDDVGYRSAGSYLVDINQKGEIIIVNRDFSNDDYGSPSRVFAGISHFPLNYWDTEKIIINDRWSTGRESDFYWHDNHPPVAIYPGKIGLGPNLEKIELKEDQKIDGLNYHIWKFRGRNHLIIFGDLSEYRKLKDRYGHLYGYYVDHLENELKEVMEKFNISQDCLVSLEYL